MTREQILNICKRIEENKATEEEICALRDLAIKVQVLTEALRIALSSLSRIALTVTSGHRLREYAQDALSAVNELDPAALKTATQAAPAATPAPSAVVSTDGDQGTKPAAAAPSSIAPSAVEHLIWQIENNESFDKSMMLKALHSSLSPSAIGPPVDRASVLNNLLLVIEAHLHSPACQLDNNELDHWCGVIRGWIERASTT